MAQRWPAPKTKPKLEQTEFDDAVKTNIEDFDMSPDEAVKSSVAEFELQGYDLSAVVKTAQGGDLAKHPVSLATEAISLATATGSTQPAAVKAAFGQLQRALDDAAAAGPEAVQQASAVALQCGTLKVVLTGVQRLNEQPQPCSQAIQAGLAAGRALMAPSLNVRDTFDEVGGPQLVMALHTGHADDVSLQAELARCAECASYREEQNKEQLVECGYAVSLLQLLAQHCASPASSNGAAPQEANGGPPHSVDAPQDGAGVSEPFVAAACGVLRSVCTADDDRPPSSKAFSTARLLAKQHQALRVLLGVLRRLPGPDAAPTVAAVLSTVRQLAANEEICKDFSDEGGVSTCLRLISSLAGNSKEVVRCGLGALRQLSHSDITKRLLAERGAAPALMRVTAAYPGDAEVLEPALGVVANMTLRQPEVVTVCAEEGVVDWVLEAMRQLPANALVQRQAAILTRNMVVRNPELRPTFLDKGAEALLRAAKQAHPRNCTDVGSAALRDLGLDNYNN